MLDKSIFTSEIPYQDEVVSVDVRGYTLKRKLAIGLWFALLVLTAFITYALYAQQCAGVDWFVHIRLWLMSNTRHGSAWQDTMNIPLIPCGLALGLTCFAWTGYHWLKAMIVQPVTRTHLMRIHAMRANDTEPT